MPDSELYAVKSENSRSISTLVLFAAGVAAVCAVVALVLAAILLAKINGQNPSASGYQTIQPVPISREPLPPPPVSHSPGWEIAAGILNNSVDFTADPCQDFYNFSCGQWISKHSIPPGHSSTISFGVVNQQILNQMSTVMKQTNTTWAKSVQQAALAYQICMGAQNSNYDGSQVLNIVNMYGGLPMITKNWTPTNVNWTHPDKLMGILAGKYGINTLITPIIDTNWKSPTNHSLFLDQATLFYPTIYFTTPSLWNSTFRPAYKKLLTNVATLLAKDTNIILDTGVLQQDVNDLLNFELMIAKFNIPSMNRRNYTTQWIPSSVHDAEHQWSSIPWLNVLSAYASSNNNGLVTPTTLTSGSFILSAMSYVTQLNGYLSTLSADITTATWPRKFQNYLIWRLMANQLSFIPGYSYHFDEFKKEVEGLDDVAPSNSSCASTIINMLAYPASRLYIDYHFNKLPANTRSSLSQMISNILSAFQTMVQGLTWMTSMTKTQVNNKVAGLYKNVAYPDWIMNNTLLDQHYSSLSIRSSDNWMIVLNKLALFNVQFQLSLLVIPTNRHNFLGPPAIVNAWYQPELNSITFPAGIINQPFFSTLFPNSVNYGAMGVVMGHELTHGFDDEGVQWGPTGVLADWMDSKSYAGFKTMAQCVIDEYSGFCYQNFTPSCINGVRTQGENIADNGGIQAAFHAYRSLSSVPQPRLPGIMSQYNHDQIFFMSFAQVWCRKVTKTGLQRQLLIDPHSPARFRVIGTVRNFPQFAKTFQCPAGSPMAPQKHCSVWS